MNTLAFTDDMACLQRCTAESHDLVIRRGIVLGALNLRTGERVLELGCGGGYYTYEAARFVGPTGRICAIDISLDQIAAAQARCAELAWVECWQGDVSAPQYGDAEFDTVFAVQVLEYLADLDSALPHPPDAATRRAPHHRGHGVELGGVALGECVTDAAGAGRIRAPFACRDLPSILAARLRWAGIQPLRQTAIPILNTSYSPASFSYWAARVIRSFVVSRQAITEEEAADWFEELAKLEESGAYFFCLTPIMTESVKAG